MDDDPALIAALSEGLQLLGNHEVIVATDGAAGLERFFALAPDCVVVDVRMPRLNGYQLVRALRGDPATAETPILVLSALAQDREQLAGLLTGADAYLLKPVKMGDLLQAIEDAIRLTAQERQRRARLLSGDTTEP